MLLKNCYGERCEESLVTLRNVGEIGGVYLQCLHSYSGRTGRIVTKMRFTYIQDRVRLNPFLLGCIRVTTKASISFDRNISNDCCQRTDDKAGKPDDNFVRVQSLDEPGE
eukprot:gb/GECG01003855.1/.p1 GENE.gb/GECG01003855.1/~~gb/GECG01003855.1/.p1  ORF type:complete len:110 (+),score=4.22 gb/GECG01003855.1/:1-330(+)